ncbi:uncharacterized protein LOC129754051 [Uranotaenia lowii]|uniref:uncharacterized protein LOC129754051 n=1 Tax=Uranotaenia lowii TaxID=190385 RepID=UPI00247A640B|nr:uncharacterized protein LOC129754051 [Uranotaenia lowii]
MEGLWRPLAIASLILILVAAVYGGDDDQALCSGRDDFSYVRNPEFCARYFICIFGFAYPLRCSGLLWFDETTQSCRNATLVSCDLEDGPSTPAPTPGICEGARDSELVLHPGFCNTYYLCIGEVGTAVVCPFGMWFDQERGICADARDVSCPHGPTGAARCRLEENFELVPSEEYCYRFYQCVNGFPYPMICPDKMWFDEDRDVCDWEDNVECSADPGESVRPPTADICAFTPNGLQRANPTACNKFYVCVGQVGWPFVCPRNLWYDSVAQACVTSATTNCPLGPEIPPPTVTTPFTRCEDVPNLSFVASDEFCYQYFQCRNGVPFRLVCPVGLWFSLEAQRCLDRDQVDCELEHPPQTSDPTPGICSGITDGVLVEHPLHCNQYYLCVNNNGIPTLCPVGLWFNEKTQSCDNPLFVDCPHAPVTPAPDPFAICNNVFDYRFVRSEYYCYRYFQCIRGTPYPLVCQEGLWFDIQRQICDSPTNVQCDAIEPPVTRPPNFDGACEGVPDGRLVPHPGFCNEYFLCVRETGWPLICPVGLWFDFFGQTCSLAGTVGCDAAPVRPTPEVDRYAVCQGIPDNAYVRDPNFCYRYFKCVSGSPFPMICPNEQRFDERQQRCRPAADVECPVENEPPRPPATPGICNGVPNAIQVANPRACNQFYTCVNQVGFPQVCGPGLWFDEAQQTCSPPEITMCDLGPPITTTQAPHPWALCDDVPNYSFVPSPNYCYRFFQCIEGAPYPMICPGNLWFDRDRQMCADPDDVWCLVNPNPPVVPPTPGICNGVADGRQVLNPRACNHFYMCVDQVGYPLVCPANLWFDEEQQICSPPGSAYCPLSPQTTTPSPYERCQGVPDYGMVRSDFYCYRFFQCIDGAPYPMICRPGLWFDLERQMCDLSNNVQCDLRPGDEEPIIPSPNICVDIPDGRLQRNWNFCNQYYLCVSEVAFPLICPDGLWFDQNNQVCDLPENSFCPLGSPTPPPPTDDRCAGVDDLALLGDDEFCYRYFQCRSGIAYPLTCNVLEWFSEETQSCTLWLNVQCDGEDHPTENPPTEGICEGVPSGIQVQHPEFCNQFYVCNNNQAFRVLCPPGLWFHEPDQTCSSPRDADCPHGLSPTVSPVEDVCVGVADGVRVPDPRDCSWFFTCFGESGFAEPCPEGQLFDGYLLRCVSAEEAQCPDTVVTKSTLVR